jgi:hypothetical protein
MSSDPARPGHILTRTDAVAHVSFAADQSLRQEPKSCHNERNIAYRAFLPGGSGEAGGSGEDSIWVMDGRWPYRHRAWIPGLRMTEKDIARVETLLEDGYADEGYVVCSPTTGPTGSPARSGHDRRSIPPSRGPHPGRHACLGGTRRTRDDRHTRHAPAAGRPVRLSLAGLFRG